MEIRVHVSKWQMCERKRLVDLDLKENFVVTNYFFFCYQLSRLFIKEEYACCGCSNWPSSGL